MGNKVKTCQSYEPGDSIKFRCPGCGEVHVVPFKGDRSPKWTWNGKLEKPTIRPSILVRNGHYSVNWKEGDNCWCTYNAEEQAKGNPPAPYECYVCHSFVTDGRIQFLGDCTHKLAGQTVDLVDIEEPG